MKRVSQFWFFVPYQRKKLLNLWCFYNDWNFICTNDVHTLDNICITTIIHIKLELYKEYKNYGTGTKEAYSLIFLIATVFLFSNFLRFVAFGCAFKCLRRLLRLAFFIRTFVLFVYSWTSGRFTFSRTLCRFGFRLTLIRFAFRRTLDRFALTRLLLSLWSFCALSWSSGTVLQRSLVRHLNLIHTNRICFAKDTFLE